MKHRKIFQERKGLIIDPNTGKTKGLIKGRTKDKPLSHFDNPRDQYWNKVADDWLRRNDK